MNNPLFVETSAGLINLSLVTRIEETEDEVRLVFVGPQWLSTPQPVASIVEGQLVFPVLRLPKKEWSSIWSKMAEAGMLLVD
jgi:hypothetical protein